MLTQETTSYNNFELIKNNLDEVKLNKETFFQAIKKNDLSTIIELIYNGISLDIKDENGKSIEKVALDYERYDVIKLIFKFKNYN